MKPKTIGILTLIVTAIGVGWGIFHIQAVKAGSTNTAKDNIASPTAQASDHSTTTQTTNYNLLNINLPVAPPEKPKPIEAKERAQYPVQYPDRPKVIVASPAVVFVNYIDNNEHTGLVKAGFNIPLFNIGGVGAKDLTTRWTITDNGNLITGLDKWLTQYSNQPNYVVSDLPSYNFTKLWYNPDIGASGTGTLEVTIDYEYINATTGEKYNDRYKGIVDYRAQKNSQPVIRLLTPQP